MFKKMFVATLVAMLLVGVSVSTAAAQRSLKPHKHKVTSQEVPLQVVYKACQKVQTHKIATVKEALFWYKTGRMTINKVGSGIYVAVTAGGDQLVLVDSSI